MSISESVHHYNNGSLITVKDHALLLGWQHLNSKINYMEMVLKTGCAAPNVQDDVRTYRTVIDEISRLMEQRKTVEKLYA